MSAVRRALLATLIASAGCSYRASFDDCVVVCTSETGCPDGLTCGDEGLCRPAGATASCDDVLGSDAKRTEVLNVRATPTRDLDLLFVIDDSAGMAPKQGFLAAALPVFLAELAAPEGILPNLHVGVVSSDMGTKGSAVATPGPDIGMPQLGGCSGFGKAGALQLNGAAVTKSFVEDIAGPSGRVRNYTGMLSSVLGQMMALDELGCGFEQHLAAMRAALSGTAANAGFERPDAALGVIVFADEDDCSVLDPGILTASTTTFGPLQSFRCFQHGVQCDPDSPDDLGPKTGCRPRVASPFIEEPAVFQRFLVGHKADPHDIALGVVVAPPTSVAVERRTVTGFPDPILAVAHACLIQQTPRIVTADPGIRFDALVRSFPGHAQLESICGTDLAPQLTQMAQLMKRTLDDPCLTQMVADDSPDPGVQPTCLVEDVVGKTRTTIAACSAGGRPCWELVEDAARCAAQPQHLKLVVTRDAAPDPAARTIVRCLLP